MTMQPGSLDRIVLALDVDGVLLDADRGGHGRWNDAVEARFGVSAADLGTAFFGRRWPGVVIGEESVEAALRATITRERWRFDVDEFLQFWFATDFVPHAATVEWAARWGGRGVRIALATNQEHRRAAYLRERLGALIPIDDVCYSADLGVVKHDPRFFTRAARRLGIDVTRHAVVFVDDEPGNVEVARQAGWHAVHATAGGAWRSNVDELVARWSEQIR